MSEIAALADELEVLANVDDLRLHPPATNLKPVVAKPPNPAFHVKQGFAQSGFSGVMGFGPFPQASSIPPWKEPPLNRVKTSGPPSEDENPRLEATGDIPPPNGTAQMRKNAAPVGAPPPLTPQGRLQTSQQVGAPKLTVPGPSIAQQSKPKGFGTALPGLAKVKVSSPLRQMALGALPGAILGATGGALVGANTADEGHAGLGAIRGALAGGALGAVGGHVLPRMRSGMAAGMKPRAALGAIGQDLKAQVHAATAPPARMIPGIHTPSPALNPTEIGGAHINEAYKSLSPHLRGALENSNLVKAGVPPEMAMQLAYMSRNKTTGESAVGSIARHAVGGGATPPAASGQRLVSGGARLVPTNMPTNAEASVPTNVESFKAAGAKVALIERLVRLGATPIKGTPKLLMDERSPADLAKLQGAVTEGWDKHVTKPLLSRAEPLISKVPAGRVQNVLRTGARLAAEDPVGALLAHAVPVPGAFPAYLAGKKGLEHVIDKVAPLTHG
jgi:hypothetical protein